MSLLYNKALNDTLDANGAEDVTTGGAAHWYQGIGNELARGAKNIGTFYERGVQQSDDTAATALGVNQYVRRDGSVGKIREIDSTPPAELAKYEKPDIHNSSKAAVLMGDFFQQTPTVLAAAVNPLLGFAQGSAMGGDMASAEADQRGLKGNARLAYIGLSAVEDGIGGSLPGIGGIGESAVIKYGSRFVIGGTVNEALSQGFKYGRAEVLDHYGYTQQAAQLRDYDVQASLGNFVMGGVFNLAGGRARDRENYRPMPEATETPTAAAAPEAVQSGAVAPEVAAAAQPAPQSTGVRLTRQEVKQAKSDIANAERHLARIDEQRTAITGTEATGSGKQLAEARRVRSEQLAELEQQRQYSEQIRQDAQTRLEQHQDYNRNAIPQDVSDAAVHTAVHDNYVTESAPGLAADGLSESAHIRAMDSAADAFHAGRSVDVSEHFADVDTTFLAPDNVDLDAGYRDRDALTGTDLDRIDAQTRAANEQAMPESAGAEPKPRPGLVGDDGVDTYQMLSAQAEGLRATHPELADALAPHIEATRTEHARAHAEAQAYDVAAACAIVHGV